MKLDVYMTTQKMTDAALAAMVGTDRTTISRLRRGLYRPSFDLLERIAEATKGNVTPNDFLAQPSAPTPEQGEHAA